MPTPEYNSKVVIGNETIIDLTRDTIEPSDLAYGVTAHDAGAAGYESGSRGAGEGGRGWRKR